MKRSKKYNEAVKKYDQEQAFELDKAVELLKGIAGAKFDETVDIACRLNLKKNHTVRDTVVLPNTFGKDKKILVVAKGDKAKEALDAGAAYAGDTELIEKVSKGWMDFDIVVATPDMMKDVGKLGPTLGRKGLMPNPKVGTVTNDIKAAIAELKKGRIEFRADKAGVVSLGLGKISMDAAKIKENINVFFGEVLKKRPSDLKGDYVASLYVSSTMSPSVRINFKTLEH
jgi:large subunit ribosomal protein L1